MRGQIDVVRPVCYLPILLRTSTSYRYYVVYPIQELIHTSTIDELLCYEFKKYMVFL